MFQCCNSFDDIVNLPGFDQPRVMDSDSLDTEDEIQFVKQTASFGGGAAGMTNGAIFTDFFLNY